MRILAIDSSNRSVSVAICVDGVIKSSFYLNNGLTHSQTLAPLTESAFKLSGIGLNQIDLIAVCSGPGSFTGVRIGISQVKAMSDVYSIPCVEVSSLYALAYNLINIDCVACVALDARCGRVYAAFFDIKSGVISRLTSDCVLTCDEFINEVRKYAESAVIVGDMSFPDNPDIKFSVSNELKASDICRLAADIDVSCRKKGCDVLPNYLQLSQAERELKNKVGVF